MELSHVDEEGNARMVDVGAKPVSRRAAVAGGWVQLKAETIDLIRRNRIKKGDVLAVARVAGIQGGKRASELIPLCHNVFLHRVDVDFEIRADRILITGRADCAAQTGVEMEALTAVAVAALSIYDMCKAVDRDMVIGDIHLVEKTKHEL
ncbi:MAG: cyclic pyranopterin monophosphate synthase MoaC [Acidobacteriota bacterium]|jgi:cyclic pyranopterin phosphate synthase|nr:cyclic pyranopterin monophosphate synthase MoaC [Acidobacteriota bacterium]